MDTLAKRLDDIKVNVKVPGADVFAEIRGKDRVTISFGADVYARLTERTLEQHMATLARLLFAGWNRAYRAALTDEFLGHVLSGPGNDTDRQYLAARDTLVAVGRSGDGRIRLASKGLRQIRIAIADATVQTLSEHQFAERTREAVTALIRDHMAKIYELKMRFYP